MKKTSLFIISVILLLHTNSLNACTCFKKSFCGSTTPSSTVLEVEVIDKYFDSSDPTIESYADVKIIGTLQNATMYDTITLSGFLVTTCHDPLPEMNIGDTLLLNYENLSFPFQEAKYPAIELEICNTRILQVTDGTVSGFIQPNVSEIEYTDFVATIEDCADFISSNDDLEELENEIIISPNPFSDLIYLHLGKFSYEKVVVELYTQEGQRIFTLEQTPNSTYNLSALKNGIYFLKITYRKSSIVRRIIKL